MSPVNQYKKWETRMAKGVQKGAKGLFQRFGQGLSTFWRTGRQQFTIMLIPHSERRIFNFKISVFSLILAGAAVLGVGGGFLLYAAGFTGLSQDLARTSGTLNQSEANLELMRDEVGQLRRVARMFESSLNSTLEVIGIRSEPSRQEAAGRGDLASLLNFERLEQGTVQEVGELRRLRAYLESVVTPLGEVSNVLNNQKQLTMDIPTLWPLKGVRGWLTGPFGPAEHPFTGQWYLHKGMDIAYRPGTPIVATANGEITKVDYEHLGYGNYVDIRHNYGFSTKYAHMQRVYVVKGQTVARGQVIGTMGSTGLSTGPHLHYEVLIGTQVVDPVKYLNISSELTDLSGDRAF